MIYAKEIIDVFNIEGKPKSKKKAKPYILYDKDKKCEKYFNINAEEALIEEVIKLVEENYEKLNPYNVTHLELISEIIEYKGFTFKEIKFLRSNLDYLKTPKEDKTAKSLNIDKKEESVFIKKENEEKEDAYPALKDDKATEKDSPKKKCEKELDDFDTLETKTTKRKRNRHKNKKKNKNPNQKAIIEEFTGNKPSPLWDYDPWRD